MGITAAGDAYLESAHNEIELRIKREIGKATTPLVGGIVPSVQLFINGVTRIPKVAAGALFGIGGDAGAIQETPIPDDIANTELGKSLIESRRVLREVAAQKKDGVEKLLSGDLSGFRKISAANFAKTKHDNVIYPAAEGSGAGQLVQQALPAIAATLTTAANLYDMKEDQIGNIAAPPAITGKLAAVTAKTPKT